MSNKVSIWDIVSNIRTKNDDSMLDNPNVSSTFNPFIATRALANDPEYIEYCNVCNGFYDALSKEQYYTLLYESMPQSHTRSGWIKASKSDKINYIDNIMKYFECSRLEAVEYYGIYGEEWAKEVEKELGSIVKG